MKNERTTNVCRKVDLRGIIVTITGMVLMLLPLHIISDVMGEVEGYTHILGFLLIAVGLFAMLRDDLLFGFGAMAAVVSLAATAMTSIAFELGVVLEMTPMMVYCLVLYFMCTGFSRLANRLGDHHFAHGFIHHMWLDIVATAFEILVHILLHTVFHFDEALTEAITIVSIAIVLYFEFVLMLEMYRFYKKYNGSSCTEKLAE